MKSLALFLALALSPFAFAQQKPDPTDCRGTDWRNAGAGLDYRSLSCGADGGVDVHVIRVDTDTLQLDATIQQRGNARDVARTHQAAFAMNANFFDRPQQPIGVVMQSGNIVQEPKASSWQSIFLVTKDGTPKIIMPSQWKNYRSTAVMAVQAGPRLVVAGHTNHGVKKSYSAARAGVCIRPNDDLLFFATPQDVKFNMWEIQKIARRSEHDGGLGCREAMLFDGGHSTQFSLDMGDRTISVSGDPVPVFIFAAPKSMAASQ